MQHKLSVWSVLEVNILEFDIASLWPLRPALQDLSPFCRVAARLLHYITYFHAPIGVDHILLYHHEGPQKDCHRVLDLQHVHQEQAEDHRADLVPS